jgi:predicted GNAT family N-acyltransferase
VHAILFYQQAGFNVVSEPYLDAGIMHVDMQLIADKSEHRLSMTDI